MTSTMTPARKKLLYRATHRGFKEADIVVGQFAAARLPSMTDAEEAEFARLLEVPDHDLYGWVVGRQEAPENFRGPVLEQMQQFDVATALRERPT